MGAIAEGWRGNEEKEGRVFERNNARRHVPLRRPEVLLVLLEDHSTTGHSLQPGFPKPSIMAVFANKKFRSAAESNTIAARYRSALGRHPFLLFGLPFIATMVAGSFFLTPATAIRYEKHDRRVRRLTKEEELGIGKAGRRVDMKEEYYVSWTADGIA